jgi:hypothetical protein
MLQNKHQHIVRQLLQCQPLSSPHASAHAVTMENVDRVLLVDQSFLVLIRSSKVAKCRPSPSPKALVSTPVCAS